MTQALFERINAVNDECVAFFAVTASFNNLYMMIDEMHPENHHFYATRPVARALLLFRNLVNKVNLMIQTLQFENIDFEAVLNSQIHDVILNNTLALVSHQHIGWNEFIQCQHCIITTIYPLEVYHQFAINIEQHTNIVNMYCTILSGFLDEVHLLDEVIPYHITYDINLLNIAEIIINDCIRILLQTELHYTDQIKVLNDIQQL